MLNMGLKIKTQSYTEIGYNWDQMPTGLLFQQKSDELAESDLPFIYLKQWYMISLVLAA